MWDFIAANWKWLMMLKAIDMFWGYRYLIGLIGESWMKEERLTEKVKYDEYN